MEIEEYLDEFERAGKRIVQADGLPHGWKWHDYSDGSGHLQSPDGERYFSYDLNPYAAAGWVEYRSFQYNPWPCSEWNVFQGRNGESGLDPFKRFCEEKIRRELQLDRLPLDSLCADAKAKAAVANARQTTVPERVAPERD